MIDIRKELVGWWPSDYIKIENDETWIVDFIDQFLAFRGNGKYIRSIGNPNAVNLFGIDAFKKLEKLMTDEEVFSILGNIKPKAHTFLRCEAFRDTLLKELSKVFVIREFGFYISGRRGVIEIVWDTEENILELEWVLYSSEDWVIYYLRQKGKSQVVKEFTKLSTSDCTAETSSIKCAIYLVCNNINKIAE